MASPKTIKIGGKIDKFQFTIAIAGNPNTGKSTIFNRLTGLKQHTGNWPGKTVGMAEGGFEFNSTRFRIIDLPGTYSLSSISPDEIVTRDFLLHQNPSIVVVVVDATRLQRNLNLTFQMLEITDKTIICLNLIDEAERNGIYIDARELSRRLGVPVIKMTARNSKGIDDLIKTIYDIAVGNHLNSPLKLKYKGKFEEYVEKLTSQLETHFQHISNPRWYAMRLLDGDQLFMDEIRNQDKKTNTDFLAEINRMRWNLGDNYHDEIKAIIYSSVDEISSSVTKFKSKDRVFYLDRKIDNIVTSKIWGFPIMIFLLSVIFWLTIVGANIPSSLLFKFLVEDGHTILKNLSINIGFPTWLSGVLVDGAYMAMAWVISVMLPPMAIFFPLFTIFEDLGYLPRVAFNLDKLYHKAGAHGKQALTMSMGFGCNAAGVVATRIIDSPRERLIAIITNNFSLCNGRWPTQILLASIFIGVLAPVALSGLVSSLAVIFVALLGIVLSFTVSWLLSKTVLKGMSSAFSLELPPYRPPRIAEIFVRSFYERTLIVLWRAVIFAVPAGIVIWSVANINIGGISIADHFIDFADPFAIFFGLNGIIILAYIIGIPANEIVIPTVLMLTVLHLGIKDSSHSAGMMINSNSITTTGDLLKSGGWTLLTAINVMLFSLMHNPCSTTIYTIYKETKSLKWTLLATLLPIVMGLIACFIVTQIWRLI